MGKYTFLNLAEEVLLAENKALSAQEIWDRAVVHGFDKKLGSQGQTPWATLNARLLVDYRDNLSTPFVRENVKPARYSLLDKVKSQSGLDYTNKNLPKDKATVEVDEATLIEEIAAGKTAKFPYKERELHTFLVRFAHINLGGRTARQFSTKLPQRSALQSGCIRTWWASGFHLRTTTRNCLPYLAMDCRSPDFFLSS